MSDIDYLSAVRSRLDEKIKDASRYIWSDPARHEALLREAYTLWRRIVKARGETHGSYTDFKRWLRQGAVHRTD